MRCMFEPLEARQLLSAVVSVTAKGAAAYEAGPRTRFFYIRRSGSTAEPLSVYYTVGGKAKQGLDYNLIGSGVAIKAGNYLRRIEVTAIDDDIPEPHESVTLTLNTNSHYEIDSLRPAATIRIISNDENVEKTPTSIKWSSVASAAVPRSEAMVASIDNKMWVFGGYTDGTATASGRVDVYDPASNKWTKISTTMPLPSTHSGCVVVGDDVYLAGGYYGGSGGNQTFATTKVYKYDTATNTWSSMPDLPEARGGGQLAVVGDSLHFMGGSDLSRTDRNEHWALNLNGGASWTTLAPLPTVRNHIGAATIGGEIYVVGGQQNQDANEVPQAALERYDPGTDKWTTLAPLPFGRSHIAAATLVLDGRLITLGGETTYETAVKNVSMYDPATNRWSELTPIPGARSSGAATLINGVLYYTGGILTTNTWKGIITTS